MNLKNQLLLAMPDLGGDYFADTLTYVCEHTEDGAMGIIINRPSNLTLVELCAQLGMQTNRALVEVPVLEGGPVAGERGFVLHSAERSFDSSISLTDDVCLATAMDVLNAIATGNGPEHYCVALGYAGWGAGQLEQEMAANVWLSTPSRSDILFELPFEARVQAAADTLGIDFRLIAARAGHA